MRWTKIDDDGGGNKKAMWGMIDRAGKLQLKREHSRENEGVKLPAERAVCVRIIVE